MVAEKAILGTMLKESYLISETDLQPEHFAEATHRNIYQAMKELQQKGKSVDLIALLTFKNPQDLGGANYLSDLQNYANEQKFEDHLNAVLDLWREREKKRIIQQAAIEDWDIDTVTSKLATIQSNRVDDHSTIDELLAEIYESPFVERVITPGVPTGIQKLTEMTNGWQNGELTILAARPSMGKSDVMLHMGKAAGWAGFLPIIFSLEMSPKSLRDRLIASTGHFNRTKMRNPYELLTEGQKSEWSTAIGKVAQTKIQIYDRSGQTLPEIRMKIRKSMNDYPDKKPIVFIDYLTLLRAVNGNGNKHQEVGDITKGLKAIAKEFECPVISLAQLSRGVEQRQDKRPMLSDLRESGSIEEDADVVAFLYRDSYYNAEATDKTLEVIIAKNRNGSTGTIITGYNKFTGEVVEIDDSQRNAV